MIIKPVSVVPPLSVVAYWPTLYTMKRWMASLAWS